MSEHGKVKDPTSNETLEEYAGGYIREHVGRIPIWLLVVYAILFLWALYYIVVYWGGLGPGRLH